MPTPANMNEGGGETELETWRASMNSYGQGLIICEETGDTIAVVYDHKNAPVMAHGPALLEALKAVLPYALSRMEDMHQFGGDDNLSWKDASQKYESARAIIFNIEGKNDR